MGLGSSAASMVAQKKASDEQRKKEGIMNQQAAEDTALFNKQYYQDLTKRTEIQNMLRILDQNQRKADTAVAARAAITGATPEQQLAGREVNRRTFADAVADIASNASQLRDQYMRDYQGQRNRYYAQRLGMQDQLAAIHANTANQWANAATNAFAAGGSILANGLGGLQGGSPTSAAKGGVTPGEQNMIDNYLHRVGADAKANLIQQPQGF
jgi:hypothetical protein